MKKSKP